MEMSYRQLALEIWKCVGGAVQAGNAKLGIISLHLQLKLCDQMKLLS